MSIQIQDIIQACKSQKPDGQKILHERYKDTLYAICTRYLKSSADAEDVFIESFYKILTKIDTYKGEGNFEGWMRRIVVNECLMFLRKNTNLHLTIAIPEIDIADEINDNDELESFEEIIKILDELPAGYRTVFNLYVFEDYKHREIADMLGISINTSKSQLILAKKRILDIIKKKESLTFPQFNHSINNI